MITPLDIENKRFAKQMVNGYSVEEVDDFLDDLTEDYTKNYKEVSELRNKVEELNNSLEHYKSIESTLQNTLVMAQTTAEDIKNVAQKQADQIVSEAKGTAQKRVDALDNEIIAKTKELEDVKKQFDIYKAKMESLLISQLELLKDVNDSEENAKELVNLIKGMNAYVNLIPYNATEHLQFSRSNTLNIAKFYDILKKNNICVTIRREFGSKISAACGQLRSKKEEV